jgi:hypothetical protein
MITTQQASQIVNIMEQAFRGSKGLRTLTVDDQGRARVQEDLELINPTLTGLPVQLKDMPNWDLSIASCALKTLHGCPEAMNGLFISNCHNIVNLEGGPRVANELIVSESHLTSLEGLPQQLNHLDIHTSHGFNLPLLRLCLVKGLTRIVFMIEDGSYIENLTMAEHIMAKYAGKGYAAMVPCARELIRAGYKHLARL